MILGKRMKYIIVLLFGCVACFQAHSQSNIRINQYWDNPFYITPAAINNQYLAVFSMAARKQWLNFDGAPSTFFLTGSTYVDQWRTQFGIKLYSDNIGYTSTTNISLTYGYAVMLNEDWRLNLGLAGDFTNMDYDYSKAVLAEQNDPDVLLQLVRKSGFNTDFGFEFASKGIQIGAASQNFFTMMQSSKQQLQPNTNFLYGSYRQYTEGMFDYRVGACGIQYGNMYQCELFANTYYKNFTESNSEDDILQAGVMFRYPSELGIVVGVNLTPNWTVSYSYDYNTSSISRYAIGTHEITITYRIDKKPGCYSCF